MTNLVCWTTKDGRVIPVREMTDEHLVNTIKYLERRSILLADRQSAQSIDPDEQYWVEPDWFLPAAYDTMCAVAISRGLVL